MHGEVIIAVVEVVRYEAEPGIVVCVVPYQTESSCNIEIDVATRHEEAVHEFIGAWNLTADILVQP